MTGVVAEADDNDGIIATLEAYIRAGDAPEIDRSVKPIPVPSLPECQNAPRSEFTRLSKADPVFDKSVRRQRYASVFRDAKTMRQIRALHETPGSAGDTILLVSKPLFTHTSPYNPWWHENELPELPSPARQYRSPAPWRDTSDQMRVTFRHLAIKTLGPVYTLNLNLSPEVEALARDQAYPLGWLHRRISHHLDRALGRSVEFHLVGEEAEGRLHLHGEIQIADQEAKEARAALRKAGGLWDADAPNRQAVARPDPDAGWLNYLAGDLWRVGYTRDFIPRYGSPRSCYAISFKGSPTSSTELLNRRAAEIYEAHRALVKVAQASLPHSRHV